MRRAGLVLLTLASLVLGAMAWLATETGVQAQSDTSVLGNLISRVLSTPTTRVSVGSVDGALSSDATIHNITIADREGVWLRLDQARIIWRRTALFSGRLEVDRLEVGRLEFLRRPLPSAEAPPSSDEPILPELPVKVEVKAFSLAELVLGEPVVGQAARLTASGSAKLGPPSEGLDLDFQARRLDAEGRFAARLSYVPQSDALAVNLDFKEPEGGLVARYANVPGLPAIQLALQGNGTLDNWLATLRFDAGPDIGASGQARIARVNDLRRLTLDVSSRIEGLLPPVVAPVFAGTTRLTGSVDLKDSSAVETSGVTLASTTASLVLKGSVSADQTLDVTATARALPTSGSTTRAGGVGIGTLVLDARATGPLKAPNISGRFRAAEIVAPQARIGRAEATLSVDPLPASSDPKAPTRFAVAADAHAEGIVSTGSGLARAVGSRADLAVKGQWATNGEGTAETLRLKSPTLDVSYQGALGTTTVDGTLQAKAPDLSVFSDLAGRPLKGNLDLSARLSGRLDRTLGADIDAKAGNLAVGQAIADGLLGGRLTLKGHVERPQDGWSFSDFRAEGSRVSLVLNGSATGRSADLFADVSLTDLSKVDPRLAGRAAAKAHLTGSLAHPNIDATVTSGEGLRLLDRPVRDLTLSVTGSDLLDKPDAAFALNGTIGRDALTGQGRLRHPADDWILDGLQLRVGSADIAGSASLGPGGLADGTLTIRAPDLDDLSPLVLTKLSGDLSAQLNLSREEGRQNLHLQATGHSLRAGDIALSDLDANLDIRDLYGRIVVDGRINADRVSAFGQTFDHIRAAAKGTPAASDVTLSAQAKGFDLSTEARIVPQDQGIRIDLSALRAERGGRTLSLSQPASVTIRDGAATIRDLSIVAEGGRITLSGRVGDSLDLSVGISKLPLSVAEIVQPGLGLSGTAEGEATVTGTTAAPQGRYKLRLDRVVVPATRSAGLPPVGLQASGTLVGDAATIEADLRAGPEIQLRASGRVPFRTGAALDLRVTGSVDTGIANSFLGASGQRVGGQVKVDATLGGTLSDPRVEGSATLANGSFTDALRGIRLTNIRGRVSGRGDTINIELLTAVTRNGGPITVSGSVEVAPERGFPGQLRIVANRAELVSNDLATAVADLDVALSGPLAAKPSISGQVRIVSLDVSIPDQLPANVKPLPGTRHVAPPPRIRARLAARAKADRQAASAGPAFEATLDVAISAPRRIFVRGRGVDAELGGDLRLTGSMSQPDAVGAFDLRRGRLTLVGQRIELTRGRLTFAGDLIPTIDLVAETSAGDVTARILVTGPANQPSFEITSDPALPQDEVLSRLLFQKASGSLSAFQALQLAQAVSQLSGGSAGLDVFEGARRSLGLDSLDLTTGSKGGVAVGASRYISDRISVGVRAGARQEDTAATVNIDVTRHLRVQGEVGADGRTSLGVGAEWEY